MSPPLPENGESFAFYTSTKRLLGVICKTRWSEECHLVAIGELSLAHSGLRLGESINTCLHREGES